jgi:hypothetical protein
MTNTEISQYECDHLILLVGGNPLPNAVAGCCLLKEGGVITLIYSKSQTRQTSRRKQLIIEGTEEIANRLRRWFIHERKVTNRVNLQPVDDADAHNINEGVKTALKNGAGSVGLHYTGGTKAMAIHAYRAIHTVTGGNAVFSYLNPRTLEMFFDRPGEDAKRVSVGTAVNITLEEMLFLQTSLSLHRNRSYLTTPLLPQTAQAMMQVHVAGDSELDEWKEWCKVKREDPAGFPKRYQKSWFEGGVRRNWKPAQEIYADPLTEPVPTSIGDVLLDELGQSGLLSFRKAWKSHEDWAIKQKSSEQDFIEEILGFLTGGKWLEHYVLDCLLSLKTTLDFHQIVSGVVPARPKRNPTSEEDSFFEIDVIAVRGYQLFAISCGTGSGLKLKLFEAEKRARQLGGDEARTALICLAEPPAVQQLEQEAREALDSRIKLFGKMDLPQLKERLQDWIETQIGV